MLAGGKVMSVGVLKDDAGKIRQDAMDIKLALKFKFATKAFMVEVVPREEELTAEAGDSGWHL